MLRAGPVAKVFEYKLTGTLSEPKPEPLHIPNYSTSQSIIPSKRWKDFPIRSRRSRMRNRSSARRNHRHRTNTRNRFTGQLPALAEKVQSVFSAA